MRVVLLRLLGLFAAGSTSSLPSRENPEAYTAESHTYQGNALSSTSTPTPVRQVPCQGNTPQTRHQWCNYNVHTDYTTTTPDTGVTREFWLELDEAILAPDGRPRWTLAINGTIPGPTLEVDWGDTVIIHLRNNLPKSIRNGTSMHFHGIR